jgi:hypothetical protein
VASKNYTSWLNTHDLYTSLEKGLDTNFLGFISYTRHRLACQML